MDPISFGLGLVGEARHQVNSIKTRISNFREGKHMFQSLSADHERLLSNITIVERLLGACPGVLPTDIDTHFQETLEGVRDSFRDVNTSMQSLLTNTFRDGSSSSVMGKLKPKVHQFSRANALSREMNVLQKKIEQSSDQLLRLISVLANAFLSAESQKNFEALLAKIDDLRIAETTIQTFAESNFDEKLKVLMSRLEDLCNAEGIREVYKPATSTPAPVHTIRLDFISKDANGRHASPEGLLKLSVLCSPSPEIVTAAAGMLNPAYGVVGMAGVGKTVALQGLAHDEDIKKRFIDGVHYMTFGRGATLQTVIREITKIMTITGASRAVKNVKSATSLKQAVDHAVPWFEGKICLYLLDDLWPAENLPTGYLLHLRQLLRGSPKSRMAISTRNVLIATDAGCIVQFEPRNALGSESLGIFMANATRRLTAEGSNSTFDRSASVDKILAICGGLPIALSVTGCVVSKFERRYGNFEKACEIYSKKLGTKRIWLGDDCTPEGASLNAAIMLSLEYLEGEFQKIKAKNAARSEHSISDLYTSLCVLENQAWISVSVLGRLWKLGEDCTEDVVDIFCEMSLATRRFRRSSSGSPEESGIVLHDLQLEFCQQKASERSSLCFWHAELLDGYLATPHQLTPNVLLHCIVIDFKPRPWWSTEVPDDGYIHANLARHLVRAGRRIELAALLLDARWTTLRGRIGGLLALKSDFGTLENSDTAGRSPSEQEQLPAEVKQSYVQIFNAMQLAWGRKAKGARVFQFHLCGRLASLRKSSAIVDAYVKSVKMHGTKPFLLPVSSFFPDNAGSLKMEIPVGGVCHAVSCSPCGQYFAAAAGKDIVVAKTSTGDIMRRMMGHTEDVSCICFTPSSQNVVSGSWDGRVRIREWKLVSREWEGVDEKASLPRERRDNRRDLKKKSKRDRRAELLRKQLRVCAGHTSRISGVAVSGDGRSIFSGSYDSTWRTWDSTTGMQTDNIMHGQNVLCLAACAHGRKIALGLKNGTLKVMDSVTKKVLFECIKENEEELACVSFAANNLYLAAGYRNGTIVVWNTRAWKSDREIFVGRQRSAKQFFAFSPSGNQIASISGGRTIRLWDVESGKCVRISPEMDSEILTLAFTINGEEIISGSRDGVVRIWDARFDTNSNHQTRGRQVNAISISQNGLRVACALGRTVRLWDAQTGDEMGITLEGHRGEVNCVSFSPDGRAVVSGSDDMTLRLWDTDMQTEIGILSCGYVGVVSSVAFSSDGQRIISGHFFGTIRLWDAKTHDVIADSMKRQDSAVQYVSESADGCHVVSRDKTGCTTIWARDNKAMIWSSESPKNITDYKAERIIRSCLQKAPHLWPKSFREYYGEVNWEGGAVYSSVLESKALIADTLFCRSWAYHKDRKLFAAGLYSYSVAICKLVTEDDTSSLTKAKRSRIENALQDNIDKRCRKSSKPQEFGKQLH